MEIGQRFTSQSKIQEAPSEYVYIKQMENGYHYLKSATNNPLLDIVVESAWFKNRKIKLIKK